MKIKYLSLLLMGVMALVESNNINRTDNSQIISNTNKTDIVGNELDKEGLSENLRQEIKTTEKLISFQERKLEIFQQIREDSQGLVLGKDSQIISEHILDKLPSMQNTKWDMGQRSTQMGPETHIKNIPSMTTAALNANYNLPLQVHQRRIIREKKKINNFRFMQIKPISRQQEPNTKLGILLVVEEDVKLIDIKGIQRMSVSHPNQSIIAIDTSPHNEEMFYAYGTECGKLGVQGIDLVRMESLHPKVFGPSRGSERARTEQTRNNKSDEEIDNRNTTVAKKIKYPGDVSKWGAHKTPIADQYEKLFEYFQYMPDQRREIDAYEQVKNYLTQKGIQIKLSRAQYKIKGIVAYMLQGVKYIMLLDNTGYIMVLSKELEIKYHIPINMDKIREIARYSVYIAIAGDKSLMLMRMAEGGSQPVYCEGTTEDIVSIAFDQISPTTNVYAGLSNGDILVYDTRNAYMKTENQPPCQMMGKLHMETKAEASTPLSVKTLKGAIVVQNWEGRLHFFNNSDLEYQLNVNSQAGKLEPKVPESLLAEWIAEGESEVEGQHSMHTIQKGFEPKIVDIRSPGSEIFFLTRLPNASNVIILYESHIRTYKPSGGFFDIFNFKMPIIIFVILAVVGFQYYKRKNKDSEPELSKLARGNQPHASKESKDYSEQEMADITRSLGQLMKKTNNIDGSLKNIKKGGIGGRKNYRGKAPTYPNYDADDID